MAFSLSILQLSLILFCFANLLSPPVSHPLTMACMCACTIYMSQHNSNYIMCVEWNTSALRMWLRRTRLLPKCVHTTVRMCWMHIKIGCMNPISAHPLDIFNEIVKFFKFLRPTREKTSLITRFMYSFSKKQKTKKNQTRSFLIIHRIVRECFIIWYTEWMGLRPALVPYTLMLQ